MAGEIADGLAAARGSLARGDAEVAALAFDLALALRPTLSGAVRGKAVAVAQAIRGARPDLPEAKDLAPDALLAGAYLGADGGTARARSALVALDAVELPQDKLARAAVHLARGRLLAATGHAPDGIAVLREACDDGSAVWAAVVKADRPSFPRLAEETGLFSAAMEETGLAASGALDAGGARGDAAQELDDRGTWIMRSIEGGETLDAHGHAAEFLKDTLSRLLVTPHCTDVLAECAASELESARTVASYETWHQVFELRGPLPVALIALRREFHASLGAPGPASHLGEAELQAAADASPDTASPLAACASRALYALDAGQAPGARRASVRKVEDVLARAEQLSPGFAALGSFRALADLARGDVASARARFARARELCRTAHLGLQDPQIFEVACYAHFGLRDDARQVLTELRDRREVSERDAASIGGEAWSEVRAIPELLPLVHEIEPLTRPPANGRGR